MLKLAEMTGKGTQLVYLTATLPPSLEPAFLQTAGLDQKTLTVCRDQQQVRKLHVLLAVRLGRRASAEPEVMGGVLVQRREKSSRL